MSKNSLQPEPLVVLSMCFDLDLVTFSNNFPPIEFPLRYLSTAIDLCFYSYPIFACLKKKQQINKNKTPPPLPKKKKKKKKKKNKEKQFLVMSFIQCHELIYLHALFLPLLYRSLFLFILFLCLSVSVSVSINLNLLVPLCPFHFVYTTFLFSILFNSLACIFLSISFLLSPP